MISNFAGSDPGDSNHGFGIISVDPSKQFKVKILECGMLTCQINNLTDRPAKPPKSKRRKRIEVKDYDPFPTQFRLYHSEWDDIIKHYTVKRVTSERFQARGLRGKSIECVSIMNGVICTVADLHNSIYEIITAATWKNQVNRYITLVELYKEVKLPPHVIDAVFIAIYGALRWYNLDWADLDFMNVRKELLEFEFVKDL
jgi:hypothetical protein